MCPGTQAHSTLSSKAKPQVCHEERLEGLIRPAATQAAVRACKELETTWPPGVDAPKGQAPEVIAAMGCGFGVRAWSPLRSEPDGIQKMARRQVVIAPVQDTADEEYANWHNYLPILRSPDYLPLLI